MASTNLELGNDASQAQCTLHGCLVQGSGGCARCSRDAIKDYHTKRKREQRAKLKLQMKEAHEDNEATGADEHKRRRICNELVQFFNSRTKGLDVVTKSDILGQFFNHSSISELFKAPQGGVHEALVDGIRNTLSSVRVPKTSEELFMKRSSITMLMNATSTDSPRPSIAATAKLLSLHKRNFYLAKSRLKEAKNGEFPLPLCQRQPKTAGILPAKVKDMVFSFWVSHTRVSPNKKDVCRKRIGRKSYMTHPMHLLEQSQVTTTAKFFS